MQYGREHPDDPAFDMIEYGALDGCAIDDEDVWKAANPALGDFLHIDAIRGTLKTTREPAFRRYRLGQWVGQVDRWLPWGVWEPLADPARVVAGRERVALAFDRSAWDDSTALVGCTMTGHLFVEGLWEHPTTTRVGVCRVMTSTSPSTSPSTSRSPATTSWSSPPTRGAGGPRSRHGRNATGTAGSSSGTPAPRNLWPGDGPAVPGRRDRRCLPRRVRAHGRALRELHRQGDAVGRPREHGQEGLTPQDRRRRRCDRRVRPGRLACGATLHLDPPGGGDVTLDGESDDQWLFRTSGPNCRWCSSGQTAFVWGPYKTHVCAECQRLIEAGEHWLIPETVAARITVSGNHWMGVDPERWRQRERRLIEHWMTARTTCSPVAPDDDHL